MALHGITQLSCVTSHLALSHQSSCIASRFISARHITSHCSSAVARCNRELPACLFLAYLCSPTNSSTLILFQRPSTLVNSPLISDTSTLSYPTPTLPILPHPYPPYPRVLGLLRGLTASLDVSQSYLEVMTPYARKALWDRYAEQQLELSRKKDSMAHSTLTPSISKVGPSGVGDSSGRR